ncbi:MAG: thioesterase family protein [Pseudomonadota bacterium]
MPSFDVDFPIRFEHCDVAGIVFYPRYFIMFNQIVEDWFAGPLEMPWPEMHFKQRRGTPLVDIKVHFQRPSRMGDVLRLSMHVLKVGRSAIDLTITGACENEKRLEVKLTVVYTDLDKLKSARIPDDLANRMKRFMIDADIPANAP